MKVEPNKEKNLALEATGGSKYEASEQEMTLVNAVWKSLGFERRRTRATPAKNNIIENPDYSGCFKYNKKDHAIKDCPLWDIEWKRSEATKENEPKKTKHPANFRALRRKKKEEFYAT